MVTISESKWFRRGYGNSQVRYASTYVVITLAVLLVLNFYCSKVSQTLFFQSKQTSMIEKCQLACDEIAALDVINSATITTALNQMESMTAARTLVTDQAGAALYDSAGSHAGTYALLPEVLRALEGNNVFTGRYQDGTLTTRAATPIVYYGSIVGCVYMTEYDTVQGHLIQSLQRTILQVTAVLEIFVIIFSLFFAGAFSRRMRKIMSSMKIIQNGDYTHQVSIGGSDELTVLGNEFNDLMERLQTSERKRSRFVSDASHELKTPLASIKLLSDSILQNDMDTETMREFVCDIGNEADRLNRMTAKLLSLTKLEGQTEADSEIIYMAPTIRRVTRMLSPMAQKAGVHISAQLREDTPILILEDDLYQIVFNLMENGIKYNHPQGSLTVILSRREDNAVLTIQDTGMGIPEDALEHIFERFYRVDKARSRQTGGSGLGLAIVRTIALRNRGEIQVTSQPGQGSTFMVTFPAFDTEVDQDEA